MTPSDNSNEDRRVTQLDADVRAPPRPPSETRDPDEHRRRSEAVRRAVQELALRGIRTDEYLLNLIAQDDVYRVRFVKKQGRQLNAHITVDVRREDFEILSIEGSGLANRADAGS